MAQQVLPQDLTGLGLLENWEENRTVSPGMTRLHEVAQKIGAKLT